MHLTLLHVSLASSVCWVLCRYATAVNAEKKETSDKIRRKVDEMTEKMKLPLSALVISMIGNIRKLTPS